uniref:Uncharacterized protein n=1 Tax=Rhizophora mucronata TaxID=61149 RepID=A0A2P2QNV7_RHIMU
MLLLLIFFLHQVGFVCFWSSKIFSSLYEQEPYK